jgi:hypothetical protein
MVFDRFAPEGNVFFMPETIPDWQSLKKPIPARFYSAHYCFTLGQFAKEVQHNPEYYFHGKKYPLPLGLILGDMIYFIPHFPIIYA